MYFIPSDLGISRHWKLWRDRILYVSYWFWRKFNADRRIFRILGIFQILLTRSCHVGYTGLTLWTTMRSTKDLDWRLLLVIVQTFASTRNQQTILSIARARGNRGEESKGIQGTPREKVSVAAVRKVPVSRPSVLHKVASGRAVKYRRPSKPQASQN